MVIGGVQSLKLSTKATAFKKVILLIGGAKHSNWGGRPTGTSLLAPALSSFLMICVFWIRNVTLNFCRKIFSRT